MNILRSGVSWDGARRPDHICRWAEPRNQIKRPSQNLKRHLWGLQQLLLTGEGFSFREQIEVPKYINLPSSPKERSSQLKKKEEEKNSN